MKKQPIRPHLKKKKKIPNCPFKHKNAALHTNIWNALMINYQTVCVHQSHSEWFGSARSEQNKVMDHGWENDFDPMAFSDIFLTTSITSLWHVALLALVLFPISYRHKKIVGFAMFAVFLFTVFGNIYFVLPSLRSSRRHSEQDDT